MAARWLIKNATVVSMDPEIGILERGDLLIEDGRIARLGFDLSCEDASRIDADRMIAAPGFVDTHRHVWQTQLRGVAADWSLFDYSVTMRNAFPACYEAEDAFLGNYVGALEALDAGVTTVVDHSHLQVSEEHTRALADGLRRAGIRGVYCVGLYANPRLQPGGALDQGQLFATPEQAAAQRDLVERFREHHFADDGGLLRFGIATTEWVATTPDAVADEVAWCRRLAPATISTHVGMGLGEDLRVVPALAERGLLGDDLLFVHGAHLSDADLDALARQGGFVSSTPETELQMGMGFPVVDRVAASGKEPSLGIDIVSNFAGDMFSQMRLMLQAQRFQDYEREGRLPLNSRRPAAEILHTATQGGATAIGLGDLVGSLRPGKQADLLLVRTDGIHMAPVNDPVAALVFYANAADVDTVMVAGQLRKQNGRLVEVEWPKLRCDLEDSRDRILRRFAAMPLTQLRELWAPIWEGLTEPPA